MTTSASDDAPELEEAAAARERLVGGIERSGPPWSGAASYDPAVLDVLRRVPRHRFMPGASLYDAYQDRPFPIGLGQTISQPTIVAIMTQALELSGEERVLEIGTGSGYQAAVLSRLAREVFSIELLEPLGKQAAGILAELGHQNVRVRVGDGYQGWPEHAPFDRIILTAAPPEIPAELVEQLGDPGILVAPEGEDRQTLVRLRKRDGRVEREELIGVRFVPMVPGDE